jgi:hypothetical protein
MYYKKHSSRRCPGIANQNHGQVAGSVGKKISENDSRNITKLFHRFLLIRFVADADPDPYQNVTDPQHWL